MLFRGIEIEQVDDLAKTVEVLRFAVQIKDREIQGLLLQRLSKQVADTQADSIREVELPKTDDILLTDEAHGRTYCLSGAWSIRDKQPKLVSGEFLIKHEAGSSIQFKADGTVIYRGVDDDGLQSALVVPK